MQHASWLPGLLRAMIKLYRWLLLHIFAAPCTPFGAGLHAEHLHPACRLPTPVQSEALPLILGGGDVMAAAETGSGKTGAFALPILQIVHESIVERQNGPTKAAS